MPRLALALAALLVAAPAAAADRPEPGCVQPLDAMQIARTLARQHVGTGYSRQGGSAAMTEAVSGDKRIWIFAFGCLGDYRDELEREDRDARENGYRFTRFTNDEAMVLAIFWPTPPPTPREAIITRATLAALSGD